MEAPAGPLPGFRVRSPDGTERDATAEDWTLLRPPPADFSADPPEQSSGDLRAEVLANQGIATPYGSGRLGRTRRVVPDGWVQPGPVPPWQDSPELDWLDEGRVGFSAIQPGEWKPGDNLAAYVRARRIIRQVGFRLGVERAWVFRDTHRRWWVLHEQSVGGLVGPVDGPACTLVRLGRSDSSLPFGGEGIFWGGPNASDLTEAILADFGGPYGPLHWAFIVAEAGRRFQRAIRNDRVWQHRTQALVDRPEWAALRQAIEKDWPHGGGLREVVSVLEGELRNGPVATAVSAYAYGFEHGEALAWLQAEFRIAQKESERNRGKPELREELRRAAIEVAGNEKLRPTVLARVLIGELDTTERGKRLARLGLSRDENRVATMIREEAEAAGVYQTRRRGSGIDRRSS